MAAILSRVLRVNLPFPVDVPGLHPPCPCLYSCLYRDADFCPVLSDLRPSPDPDYPPGSDSFLDVYDHCSLFSCSCDHHLFHLFCHPRKGKQQICVTRMKGTEKMGGQVKHICLHQWKGSSLVQVMPCPHAKPLPEPTLKYSPSYPIEQTWMKSKSSKSSMLKYIFEMSSAECLPYYWGFNVVR